MANFNFSKKPEYQLHTSMIDEVINLYGVQIKFLIVERINLDDVVFGDFSHLKSDGDKIYDMMALPETSEQFDVQNYQFSEFGFNLFENTALYVSAKAFKDINLEMKSIIGNLIVFPNNKVHEITDVDWQSPGINNLYTYQDQKSVYKLSTKPYEFKLNSEIENEHVQNNYTPDDLTQFTKDLDTAFSQELPEDFSNQESNEHFDKLDNYFEELLKVKESQTNEAEIKDTVKSAVQEEKPFTPIKDREHNESIVKHIENNPWNEF